MPPSRDQWRRANGRVWRWAPRLTPGEWCERHVVIPANAINPEPGKYDFRRTPYLREITDTVIDPAVREVWLLKATQLGFTRLLVNLIGYWADQDPGALGLLMPDEDTVKEIFGEELKPTIDATPVLRRRKSSRAWDTTVDEIWLDSMPIFGLYAGSVQKLARRSLRYILLDELDKFRPFKREASPIQLLKKRTSNWMHRARLVAGSTPTTPDGNITVGYESCPDQRRYWLPCPKCGKFQVPLWSQVKGFKEAPGEDKFQRANWLRLHPDAVFYECDNCRDQWPGEKMKRAPIITAGRWASQGQTVIDGRLDGPRPDSTKVGFHAWAVLSPWIDLSELAAEFVEAEGDANKTQDFRNARLALPYFVAAKTVRPSVVRDKRSIAPPPLIVPRWAVYLYASVDTQKDWFAVAIRAWGWGMKSQLVWWGQVTGGFEELRKVTLDARFEIEGGGVASPKAMLIDSGGDRTNDVYEFARRDPRIYACKGMARSGVKLWYDSEPKPGIRLRMVDTNHFKGALWNLLHDPDPTKWLPHRDVPEQYCLEMGAESLVKRGNKWAWEENGTARNEAWDLEVLQVAAATMDNVAVQQGNAETSAARP